MADGYDLETLPLPRDVNGWIMGDRGTELYVHTETLTETAKNVILAQDCKEFAIFVQSGKTLVMRGTAPGTRLFMNAAAAVDVTGGEVDLAITGHGFTVGDTVAIKGTTNYNGFYVLQTGTATNAIRITATYVAESIPATAYCDGYRDVEVTGSTGPIPIVKEAGTALFIGKIKTGQTSGTIDIWAWR